MKPLIKKILVAISGSDSSINGAKYAIMLSKIFKWELSVVSVVDTSTLKELLISKIFIEEESSDFEKNLEANGNRYLDYIEELAKSKGVKIKKILKRGGVSTMILEAAEEEGVDQIILGAWQVNRAKKDLITRAHLDILLDSKISVLVVKEQDIEILFKRF
ncbi:MAG: universal stress protein [Spirochaetes bacterium]|nr:universal stress protein [Spirochaetota bacterium]